MSISRKITLKTMKSAKVWRNIHKQKKRLKIDARHLKLILNY